MKAVLLIAALSAGIASALQSQLMGRLDRSLGTMTNVLLTYGFGGLVAALIFAASRERLTPLRELPWYAWLPGILGLMIVAGLGYASPRIGLSSTLVLAVAGQLGSGLLIDHFGLLDATRRAIDVPRASGFMLVMIGVWLVVRR